MSEDTNEDPGPGSQVHRNPEFGGDEHDEDCLCVLCHSAYHVAGCRCWICESARWYFWPAPEARVLVDSDQTARHLAELGLPTREVARRAGVSPSVVWKASRAGARIDEKTAAAILAVR